jgi:hypothetical protein
LLAQQLLIQSQAPTMASVKCRTNQPANEIAGNTAFTANGGGVVQTKVSFHLFFKNGWQAPFLFFD